MGSRNPKEEREDRLDAKAQEARERAEAEAKGPPLEVLPAPDPKSLLDMGVQAHLLALRAQASADAEQRADYLRRAGEYVERMRTMVEELKQELGA